MVAERTVGRMSQRSVPDPERRREIRSVAKGGALGVAASLTERALGLITQTLLARLLGASSLGIYVVAREAVFFGQLFSMLGLSVGTLRFASVFEGRGEPERTRGVIMGGAGIGLISSALVTAFLVIAAPWLAVEVFHKPEVVDALRWAALGLPFISLAVILATATMARRSIIYLAARGLATRGGFLLVIIPLGLLFGWNVPTAVAAFVISATLGFGVAVLGVKRFFPGIGLAHLRQCNYRELLTYSAPLAVVALTEYGLWKFNILIGGAMIDSARVGMYTIAATIADLGALGPTAVARILQPSIADLYARGRSETLQHVFSTATRWMSYLTAPMMAFLIVKARSALQIFGEEFVDAERALQILCVAQIINASTGGVAVALGMAGQQWVYLGLNVFTVALNVTTCVLLVPRYGMVGLAMAAAISYGSAHILRAIAVWATCGLRAFDLTLLKPFAATAVALVVPLVISHPSFIPDIVLAGVPFVLVYAVVVWALGIDPSERQMLRDLRDRIFGAEEAGR